MMMVYRSFSDFYILRCARNSVSTGCSITLSTRRAYAFRLHSKEVCLAAGAYPVLQETVFPKWVCVLARDIVEPIPHQKEDFVLGCQGRGFFGILQRPHGTVKEFLDRRFQDILDYYTVQSESSRISARSFKVGG